jgi:outer membrane biosynthesis protein TonB
MKRILLIGLALAAFASSYAEVVYVKSPAAERSTIKKQAKDDQTIVFGESTGKKSREEADKEAISALKDIVNVYVTEEFVVIPAGKEMLAEPQRASIVLRIENKQYGTYDSFIYANVNDLIKTPAENKEIMSHSDWTETATVKFKEGSDTEAEPETAAAPKAESASVAETVTETPAVEEAPAETASAEVAVAQVTPTEAASVEESAEAVSVEETSAEAPAEVAESKAVVAEQSEAKAEVAETSKAVEPAEPAVAAQTKKVAETATAATATTTTAATATTTTTAAAASTKTSFEVLVDDLTDAGLSQSINKLSNATKLRKIKGFGAYKSCANPKASYIVAADADGHYVVLGPEKADGTRKNYSNGATGQNLSDYTPKLWFRR